MQTVYKFTLALAAGVTAAAASAQVGGLGADVAGRAGGTLEAQVPLPDAERTVDRVTSTSDRAAARAKHQVETRTSRAVEAIERNAERAEQRLEDTAPDAEAEAEAEAEIGARAETPGASVSTEARAGTRARVGD